MKRYWKKLNLFEKVQFVCAVITITVLTVKSGESIIYLMLNRPEVPAVIICIVIIAIFIHEAYKLEVELKGRVVHVSTHKEETNEP